MTYAVVALGVVSFSLLAALVSERRRSDAAREALMKEMALERGALLQRIQAPEIAVHEFSERPERRRVRPVPIDDDKAYAEAQERRMNGADG